MMREIEQLYRSQAAPLLVYLRRSFGWCGCAEDLLHETFLKALAQERRLSEASSPRAWLFGIARHVGQSAARGRRVTVPLDPAAPAAPPASDRIADMREAIAQLPEAMRETLELRLREAMSYEEIAQILDIPIGTVRSRLHTAMLRLRAALE